MEIGWICAVAALALAAAILLLKWALLRASLREVSRELAEKLRTDTNTLISLSSGDRAVRALAAQMNIQLQALRRERLRLQKGDAELKNAITNVSHDLRTPLTAICGYLELLEKEEHSEKARRYLAVIRERSQAMRDLTEELFRYSMAAAAAEEMTRQPVSVKDVLEQSLAGFYGSLTEKGISPEIRLPNGPVTRNLDPAALRRIFDNLLNNALKYSDGDLRVSLTEAGEAFFPTPPGNWTACRPSGCSTGFTLWKPPAVPPDWGFPSPTCWWRKWAARSARNTFLAGCGFLCAFRKRRGEGDLPGQSPGVFPHGGTGVEQHQQFRNGHGVPQCPSPGQRRQQQNQRAADHQPPPNGDHEGRPGLQNGLEIIGGEDVHGQKQEGEVVGPDDPGAMARISGEGFMKTRTYRFGQDRLRAVQKRPKTAVVPRARRRVARMRSPFPAPKLVEKIG